MSVDRHARGARRERRVQAGRDLARSTSCCCAVSRRAAMSPAGSAQMSKRPPFWRRWTAVLKPRQSVRSDRQAAAILPAGEKEHMSSSQPAASPGNPEALKPFISRALDSALTQAEAEQAFDVIMSGQATASQIGGFLMILRLRGESIEEITGATTIMRAKCRKVRAPAGAIDIVGTGGDGKGTLNISTAAALVTASLGVPVAKHGNKAQSSKSGTADTLALLGVNIDADVATTERSLAVCRIGYMNAPNYHAAMRHVMPARIELGVRTIFNILGPLTNP